MPANLRSLTDFSSTTANLYAAALGELALVYLSMQVPSLSESIMTLPVALECLMAAVACVRKLSISVPAALLKAESNLYACRELHSK